MADLRTDYKDDVLDTSKNEKRKYNMITNEDGTVSLVDATDYSQVGDSFGAADINATNKKVNELDTNLTADGLQFKFSTDGEGNYGYLGADGSLIPFSNGIKEFCCAIYVGVSECMLFDYENKTVIGGNTTGSYLKISYSSSYYKITALQPGKYNVINGSGVLSEIEAKAGDILVEQHVDAAHANKIYCAAWI